MNWAEVDTKYGGNAIEKIGKYQMTRISGGRVQYSGTAKAQIFNYTSQYTASITIDDGIDTEVINSFDNLDDAKRFLEEILENGGPIQEYEQVSTYSKLVVQK